MSQSQLVIRVFDALEALGVPAMLVGSHASSLHGDARSTHDIDVVVELALSHIDALLDHFPEPEHYASRAAIVDAIRSGSSFNIIQITSGYKIDFFFVGSDPFDRAAFSRRRLESVEDRLIPVMTPEDTILQKLRWSVMCGGSEKQFLDALGVFEVQYPTLDIAYLENWVGHLGVERLYERLRAEARVEPM